MYGQRIVQTRDDVRRFWQKNFQDSLGQKSRFAGLGKGASGCITPVLAPKFAKISR